MFNVYNHWDKLKSCIVGRTYGPDFYSFVKDKKIRSNLCKIAEGINPVTGVETRVSLECSDNSAVYKPAMPGS